jgi:hypothetical protein
MALHQYLLDPPTAGAATQGCCGPNDDRDAGTSIATLALSPR